MAMKPGERQVAPTLDGIRRDHVARYEWAARLLPGGSRVIDFACGVGYGSRILADAGHCVSGLDVDADALRYAREHYLSPRVSFYRQDALKPDELPDVDAAVCFETIEHVEDPRPLLRALHKAAPKLIASVPNEHWMPFKGPGHENGYAFHHRHYTPQQFEELLEECGWMVETWMCQAGPESEVEPGVSGRTVIAVCRHAYAVIDISLPDGWSEDFAPTQPPYDARPLHGKHVAILGLGPSVRQFMEITRALGGRSAYCDEVWGINALGDVFACDRIFHMDDVRIQEIRSAARPESNIANMLRWLKDHPGPIVTSRAHPEYPGLVEFPLAEVLSEFPTAYFNSTAAYAVALAIHEGARKISCFGMDFTYPDAHDAEKGRACVEFWLGIAAARGIELAMPKTTSLMDALHPQRDRFYGFDTQDLEFKRSGAGIEVKRTERTTLPTADEVESAYDHSKHPNPLVDAGTN